MNCPKCRKKAIVVESNKVPALKGTGVEEPREPSTRRRRRCSNKSCGYRWTLWEVIEVRVLKSTDPNYKPGDVIK